MSEPLSRFTVSIPQSLLEQFDAVSAGKGYGSRSEAVRDAIRDSLVEHQWTESREAGEVVGTIVLVYDHQTRRTSEELIDQQHHHHHNVLSSLHIHLDERNCLEVIVVRGTGSEVSHLADALISLRGVKHGRLVCSTTGTDLA
ncbi:MAG: nickel-responsive transcriptional regulator NikR [Armatimonadetes bacterium]|nr:nickel-responsive transcriptional regulator NikR [Armatimonadota bacterium]